jgi:hypothetical protein
MKSSMSIICIIFNNIREEELTPLSYKADWLLTPPSRNQYLIKKEYMYRPNIIDRIANKIFQIAFDKENEDIIKTIETHKRLVEASTKVDKIKQIK